MKLRNKKTGEIVIASVMRMVSGVDFDCGRTLAELNEEWEDYEEPKGKWFISNNGQIHNDEEHERYREERKQIGNYFETREEAEKAVEKLKAWKRVKDTGFKFTGWDRHPEYPGDFRITASDELSGDDKDLDLLFGGEE